MGEKTLKLFLSDASKTTLEKLKQSLVIPEEEATRLPEIAYFLNEPETQKTLSTLLKNQPGLLAADPFSYALAEETIAKASRKNEADLFLLFDFKKLEKSFLSEGDSVFLQQLFGGIWAELKTRFQLQKSPKLKAQYLTDELEKAFRQQKCYPAVFKINAPGKTSGSTYLFLVSKRPATYFKAKEWLATFSEFQEDGVSLLGVNLNYQPAAIPGFSNFLNKFSLQNLTQELAARKPDFHYQTIREVYETHSLATPYVLANYVAAFKQLSAAGTVNLVDANNKKVTRITPEAVVFYRLHTSEPKPTKRLR